MSSKALLIIISLLALFAAYYYYFEPKQMRSEILARTGLQGQALKTAENALNRLNRRELERLHTSIDWGLTGYAFDIFNAIKNLKTN